MITVVAMLARHLAPRCTRPCRRQHHQSLFPVRKRSSLSLCARTIPDRVQLAMSSAPDKSWFPIRFSEADIDSGAGRRRARTTEGSPNSRRIRRRSDTRLFGLFRMALSRKRRTSVEESGCTGGCPGHARWRSVHELRHRVPFEGKPSAGQLVQAHRQRNSRSGRRFSFPAAARATCRTASPGPWPVLVLEESVTWRCRNRSP